MNFSATLLKEGKIHCKQKQFTFFFSFRRVHISERTSSFLSGEFDLEPGEGESREDGIRQAGIKTFLIKSVLKPVSIETSHEDALKMH